MICMIFQKNRGNEDGGGIEALPVLLGIGNSVGGMTMTNADKIRSMTDDELADFLFSYVEPCLLCAWKGAGCANGDCEDGRLAWLREKWEG